MRTPEEFWNWVDRSGECWIWTGGKHSAGYGSLNWQGKTAHAHRVSYELLVGAIPEGLQIDHLCRVPACVNPAHLEPVTQRENALRGYGVSGINARKTHCIRGHDITIGSPNTYMLPRGGRNCRTCRAEAKREFAERHRGERQAA